MLKDALCCQYFTVLEQSVPVNAYRMGGIHFWPFVRNFLYSPLMHHILPVVPAEAEARIAARFHAILAALGLPHSSVSENGPPPVTPSITAGAHRSSVLFFTRPIEHSGTVPDGFYAPILDPWFEAALEAGPALKAEFIENASLTQQPRRHGTFLLVPPAQARIQAAQAALMADGFTALRDLLVRIADFSRTELLVDIGGVLDAVVRNFIVCMAHKTEMAAYLAAVRPRALALICHYYPVGMGVVWACHEQGVRTLELQHGMNGDCHPGYTHWTAVPPEGYALLPDVFSTWGETSLGNIMRWWPRNGHPHRAVIGGRPDLDVGAGLDAHAAAAAEVLTPLKARHRRTILVSLAAESIDPLFTDIIAKAPRDWLWLLRSHPRTLTEPVPGASPDDIHAILSGRGFTNFETHITSRAFLSTVLAHADHLLTRQSSSWMEAFAFGVPTTFVNSQARTIYASLLQERRARYVDTVEELVAGVERGWDGLVTEGPSVIVSDPALMRRTLNTVLNGR